MRLFWKKTHRPRTYHKLSAKQKVDELLSKTWLADLKQHPTYAREIARQRFGFSPEPEGEYTGEAQPDLLDVLRQAKEAKDLIKEEVEGKGNTLTAIAEIVKALPTIAQILPQIQQAPPTKQPQIAQPEPEQLAEPEAKTPQEAMTLFANRFLELEPEVAGAELYQNRDESGDVRQAIYSYLSENSLDECLEMIPTLIEMPEYSFLAPFAQKLSTNKGKRWLSLVVDEVNKLKLQ